MLETVTLETTVRRACQFITELSVEDADDTARRMGIRAANGQTSKDALMLALHNPRFDASFVVKIANEIMPYAQHTYADGLVRVEVVPSEQQMEARPAKPFG